MNKQLLKNLCLAAVASTMLSSAASAQDKEMASDLSPYVDKKGNISLPKDYRTSWTHMGSWHLKEGGAAGMHDVYTEKKYVDAYNETGVWPDGTTIVKEINAFEEGAKTTGHAMWSGKTAQWFVMVKDSKNRFKDNALWGDGWGWALFKPEDTSKQLAKSYQADCMGCHIPAAATDRIFVEGYPVLTKKK